MLVLEILRRCFAATLCGSARSRMAKCPPPVGLLNPICLDILPRILYSIGRFYCGGWYSQNSIFPCLQVWFLKHRCLCLSLSVAYYKTAVLWRVVFGGRMLHRPWLPRLQVIVIATPFCRFIAICRISQEMKDIIDAVSPRVAYCGRLNDGFPTWVSEIPRPVPDLFRFA